ncbi:Uncharacterised protein [Mycobacterium tuberculosis]|nr:Uncharacterised protein [Mycobacterium tuberculosis]
MRQVVGAASLPGKLHRPATVLVAPRVPGEAVGVKAACHQGRGDGLLHGQHRRAVGQDRVRRGCQLGRARAFQQYRVGKPADTGDVGARCRSDLFDRRAGPNSGLNLLGAQHVGDLDVQLGLLRLDGVVP